MDLSKPNHAGGLIIVALAVLVPWLTWWLLTTPNPNMAVTETPIMLSGLGLLLVMATYIGMVDLALGLFVGYMVIRTIPALSPYGFELAYLLVLGSMGVVTLAQLPADMLPLLRAVVLAGGVCQAAYGMLQAIGYDPIWLGWAYHVDPTLGIRGTLGNRDFYGAYCAILLATSPVWLMPVFVVGLVLSKSVLACGAAVIGLAVRYRSSWVGSALAASGVSGVIWYAFHRSDGWASLWHRTDVWAYAIKDWALHPLLGWGTGQWPLRIPNAQLTTTVSEISRDVFVQAHNEYLQVLYDGGLIAVGLLCWWGWNHRGLLTGPSAGIIAVLAVNCLANFPFHVGTTALLSLTLIGLALAEERTCYVDVAATNKNVVRARSADRGAHRESDPVTA